MSKRKKNWYDKHKMIIYDGDYLRHDTGDIYKIVQYQETLYMLEEGYESMYPLTEFPYDDAFDSIDLKRNEYRLREFEVYK